MACTCAHEYLLVCVRVSQGTHARTPKFPHASPFRAHTQLRVVLPQHLTASPQSKPLIRDLNPQQAVLLVQRVMRNHISMSPRRLYRLLRLFNLR